MDRSPRGGRCDTRRTGRGGDGATVEVRADDRAGWPAADQVALASEDRVGGVHRAAGGAKPLGQAARRWQAIARPQLTGPDRGADVLTDLAVEWNGVVANEREASQAGRRCSRHGLLNLVHLGTID